MCNFGFTLEKNQSSDNTGSQIREVEKAPAPDPETEHQATRPPPVTPCPKAKESHNDFQQPRPAWPVFVLHTNEITLPVLFCILCLSPNVTCAGCTHVVAGSCSPLASLFLCSLVSKPHNVCI